MGEETAPVWRTDRTFSKRWAPWIMRLCPRMRITEEPFMPSEICWQRKTYLFKPASGKFSQRLGRLGKFQDLQHIDLILSCIKRNIMLGSTKWCVGVDTKSRCEFSYWGRVSANWEGVCGGGEAGFCFVNETSWMWRDSEAENCWHGTKHHPLGKAANARQEQRDRTERGQREAEETHGCRK